MFAINKPLLDDNRHKGDDVKSYVDNWVHGVMMNVGCRVSGHVGNDNKILIDQGLIEFLRNVTTR